MLKRTLKPIALLALALSGCTVQREYTITPIDHVPKGEKHLVTRHKGTVAITGKDSVPGTRTPNVVEIYDIGATTDANGDLVGKHKLYRVVETSKWVLASHVKSPDIPSPAPKTATKDQDVVARAVTEARLAARSEVRNAMAGQAGQQAGNLATGQQLEQPAEQSNPVPDDPTKLDTPTAAEQQALDAFQNAKPAPSP